MERARAAYNKAQSKRYDKWKRKQVRRVVIHRSVKFPKYEYDTNQYDPESPDAQCPVLHRFQTFMFDTKLKGVQQVIDHFNRFLWHSAGGEEITARQFFDFVVSERARNSWYVCLHRTFPSDFIRLTRLTSRPLLG
jgi:hypothetical protein